MKNKYYHTYHEYMYLMCQAHSKRAAEWKVAQYIAKHYHQNHDYVLIVLKTAIKPKRNCMYYNVK